MDDDVKMRGIRVSQKLWDKVKQKAEKEDRTVGFQVIRLLKNFVGEEVKVK